MEAVTPHNTPWDRALRGSSEGVKDEDAKTSATQAPGRAYRNHVRALAALVSVRGSVSANESPPAISPMSPPALVVMPARSLLSSVLRDRVGHRHL